MDPFKNFEGFAVMPGNDYETFYHDSPTGVARRVLKSYRGTFVEIGFEICGTGEMKKIEDTVPRADASIDTLFDGVNADYVYIDFPKEQTPMYILQRMMIGSHSITQVERRSK